jgi:hypothetical protein
MRPVVEAAQAYCDLDAEATGETHRTLWAAVDTYRAAQKAPTDSPSATQPQDPGEVGEPATDTAQAQERCPKVWGTPAAGSHRCTLAAGHKGRHAVTDPPEAIEAATKDRLRHGVTSASGRLTQDGPLHPQTWHCSCGARGQGDPFRHPVVSAVRAAAPILTRAALHAEADEWERTGHHFAARRLRERADRIGGGQ